MTFGQALPRLACLITIGMVGFMIALNYVEQFNSLKAILGPAKLAEHPEVSGNMPLIACGALGVTLICFFAVVETWKKIGKAPAHEIGPQD